jgi:hypothetical protein
MSPSRCPARLAIQYFFAARIEAATMLVFPNNLMQWQFRDALTRHAPWGAIESATT